MRWIEKKGGAGGVKYHGEVEGLQFWVAVESEVVTWDSGAPDHDHDAEVVQLVA